MKNSQGKDIGSHLTLLLSIPVTVYLSKFSKVRGHLKLNFGTEEVYNSFNFDCMFRSNLVDSTTPQTRSLFYVVQITSSK